jgi:hypothetical protein
LLHAQRKPAAADPVAFDPFGAPNAAGVKHPARRSIER